MSPILLRPIREQLEHDRVVRQLQIRWKRRGPVAANPGAEQQASVRVNTQIHYPDLLLSSNEPGRRLRAVVEVETTESVNQLEAMAQWAHLAKVRSEFYLYVPAGFGDIARRLCEENRINVTEIWTYYAVGNQVRFSISFTSPYAKLARAKAKVKAKTKTKMSKKPKAAKKSKKIKKANVTKKALKKTAKAGKGAKRSSTSTKRKIPSKAARQRAQAKRKK